MKQVTIYVVGLSHDTAPVHVREQLALSGEEQEQALSSARALTGECVILSTCNRLEVYALADADTPPDKLLGSIFGDRVAGLEPYLYIHRGESAVRHLFRVACGIDSLVLGEVQILGQVQRAWQFAHEARTAGPVLSQLFHKAVALGKRVHSETSISRLPASVSYAAVVLARQVFGPHLAERRALVIGTGEVGEGVARCLHDYGVHATLVAHLQVDRARDLARRYQAETATWDELPRCLAESDIVVSSTAAPHYILQRHNIEEAMRERHGRPLYLIDLAVPRDIDPAAAQVPGVHLHNVDDLQAVVSTSIAERRSALPEVEALVQVEIARFLDWQRARSTAPMIKELRVQADEVVDRELAWAMSKLPGLEERERQVVEMMASRIAGKMLHGPIQWLKAQAEESARANPEPDYGMSSLSRKQLAEMFYRGTSISSEDEIG